MEEQLVELAAQVAAMEAKSNMTNTMFAEAYYYLTIPLMIIIHAGFLAYEMGASRAKNALSSGVKNILAFAFVIPAFYFFGWWVYWAMPTGFTLSAGPNGISGAEYAASIALGWGESAAYMGPNLADQIDGVFWGAFTLFAATTASIMSGAVIERIQTVGFVILAIILGGFSWTLAAAWGWHADGWLVTSWGFHDFGAAGLVHARPAAPQPRASWGTAACRRAETGWWRCCAAFIQVLAPRGRLYPSIVLRNLRARAQASLIAGESAQWKFLVPAVRPRLKSLALNADGIARPHPATGRW